MEPEELGDAVTLLPLEERIDLPLLLELDPEVLVEDRVVRELPELERVVTVRGGEIVRPEEDEEGRV